MNFYKHYIGDFQRDTGHLSLTERGAYLCLMHHYYATEKPLPNDHAALCRIAGALDKSERAAVKAAMGFFEVVDSGLMHKRIEAEIEKAGKVSDVNRDIAVAREAKRRAAKLAGSEHEQSTLRGQTVPRIEHEQNTNQTPDSTEDISKATPSHPPAFADGQSDQPTAGTIPCPYQAIVDAYHLALPGLPTVKLMPVKRQAAMRKLWGWILSSKKADGTRRAQSRDEALAWVAGYFGHAANNDFLMGRSGRTTEHAGWQCDIDFLLSERGMKIVIEKTQVAA